MSSKLWRGINAALADAMEENSSVVLFGQDVAGPGGPYGLTRGLLDRFGPERVRDAPISEGAIAGCAVGAAMLGLKPVIEIMFMDFMTLALDQLVNNAAKYRFYFPRQEDDQGSLPLVVRTLYGGRASMGPQHSQGLEAWLCHIPGLKVGFASTPQSAYGILRAAIDDPGPVVIIEPISMLSSIGDFDPSAHDPDLYKPGTSRWVRRGDRLTVVSYGTAIPICEKALDTCGISADFIDLQWLQPWDVSRVRESVERTNRVVVVHDAALDFGVGAELAARIGQEAFWHLDAPVMRVGAAFSPVPVRRRDWAQVLPDVDRVVAAIREVIQEC